MPCCFHCKYESTEAHYQRVVHNTMALHGPWAGWRMAGHELVSPDGDRVRPERLRGLLWRELVRRKLAMRRRSCAVLKLRP